MFHNILVPNPLLSFSRSLATKLSRKNLEEKIGKVILVDIPLKTNSNYRHCMAFVRLSNTSQHREFDSNINGRVIFKDVYLKIKLSRSPRRELSKQY